MVENVQYVHRRLELHIVRRMMVDNNWSSCKVEVEQEEEEEDWNLFEDNEE